jgi:succinate dehydrogenase / fumarate reductase cytochrome b subunit
MSQVAAQEAMAKPCRSEFWYRRIHSLTGVLPLSLFLVTHFLGNMYSTKRDGGVAFDEYAHGLHALTIFNILELGILLPLLYHAVYGLYRVFTREKWNALAIRNESNTRYLLQRVTGIILFVFVGVHLYSTRVQQLLYGTDVNFSFMVEHLSNPAYGAIYIIGVASACYHWANGLWGFLITWGITTGRRAQAISAKLCLAAGIALFAFGLNSFLGFFGLGVSLNF